MNVHIVCVNDGHIVPRMMRWMVDAYGWTMHDRPDASADVNYYAPYTAIVQGRTGGATAAWFTHHEYMTPGKVALWQRAEQLLDGLFVTSPAEYRRLSHTRQPSRITPGVDRQHFTIDPGAATEGLIGVSGLAAPRKGEGLVSSLYRDGYDIVAIGKGWGVPTEFVTYEEIPDFYRSLDVYLCTSLIEGIPAPPLEALSCGTKVVVPIGVGMLDELPETDGVRHYEAGNYEDMVRAIQLALDDDPDPGDLRAITEPYSIDAWCESNRRALEAVCE